MLFSPRVSGFLALICGVFLAASSVYGQQSNRVMAGVRFAGETSVVNVIIKGGPADRAGIKVGDEIMSVGEKFIIQPVDLIIALDGKNAGEQIKVEVKRGEEFLICDVRLVAATRGDLEIGEDGLPIVPETKLGILNEAAPELDVDRWYGLDEGVEAICLDDLQGKVVCMLLFQTECEYCRRFGVPQFKEVHDQFHDDPDVVFLTIQTPFFDFDKNTPEAAIDWFEELGLDVPIGHDGSEANRSHTKDAFKAVGTPWLMVLDNKGVVRFNDSRIGLEEARALFEKLKAEAGR